MSREIKFRGKAKASIEELDETGIEHNNGWVYGSYLGGYILNGIIEANSEYIVIERWIPVDKETVGQFINREAEIDTEIYEKDIVSVTEQGHQLGYYFENEYIGIVKYDEKGCTFKLELLNFIKGGEPVPDEADGIPVSDYHDEEIKEYWFGEHIVEADIDIIGNACDNPELLEEVTD